MIRRIAAVLAFCTLASFAQAQSPLRFKPNQHYTVLNPAQPTKVPAGKVEVLEVFSYGCPACNSFRPMIATLKAGLPANAQMRYLPASWHAEENWPTFQRAYLTAQALGLADRTHEAMYDAIWKTGELGIMDTSDRLKKKLPSIEQIALFYQRVAGVKAKDFVENAKSFGVDAKMRQSDAQIVAMQIPSTPTIVVNGKYRVNNQAVQSDVEFIELVKFLVSQETAAMRPAKAAK